MKQRSTLEKKATQIRNTNVIEKKQQNRKKKTTAYSNMFFMDGYVGEPNIKKTKMRIFYSCAQMFFFL